MEVSADEKNVHWKSQQLTGIYSVNGWMCFVSFWSNIFFVLFSGVNWNMHQQDLWNEVQSHHSNVSMCLFLCTSITDICRHQLDAFNSCLCKQIFGTWREYKTCVCVQLFLFISLETQQLTHHQLLNTHTYVNTQSLRLLMRQRMSNQI